MSLAKFGFKTFAIITALAHCVAFDAGLFAAPAPEAAATLTTLLALSASAVAVAVVYRLARLILPGFGRNF